MFTREDEPDLYITYLNLIRINFIEKSKLNTKNQIFLAILYISLHSISLIFAINYWIFYMDNLYKLTGGLSMSCAVATTLSKSYLFFLNKTKLFKLINNAKTLELGIISIPNYIEIN